jgi:hypothetical protein
MQSKSDFWLTLHKLSADLEREGQSDSERAENVCKVLSAVSPATKTVYLANLDAAAQALATIAAKCESEKS